eukprot:NODE_130_length_18488_cov_0.389961.p3 type:complete len:324 gc:universal NODE_130_length_18488_cov_0.389961:11627-12598(+)
MTQAIRLLFYIFVLIFVYQLIKSSPEKPHDLNDEFANKLDGEKIFQSGSLEYWISKVNIPNRYAGSIANKNTRNVIIQQLKNTGFKVELDKFTDTTPVGPIEFTNVIATKFKSNKKFSTQKKIMLAAHYDSKYFKNEDFYGTTDSATAVGLLLKLAEYLNVDCSSEYELYLVFFDGEEAFVEWSATDSVYGARHLADKWKDMLVDFEYMILFDLLGGKDASNGHIRRTPYSYKPVFEKLLQIDRNDDSFDIFGGSTYKTFDDDHRPFMEKGMKIVHVIPHEFPKVWHTADDTIENVDMSIMHGYEKLVKSFITQELRIEACLP